MLASVLECWNLARDDHNGCAKDQHLASSFNVDIKACRKIENTHMRCFSEKVVVDNLRQLMRL